MKSFDKLCANQSPKHYFNNIWCQLLLRHVVFWTCHYYTQTCVHLLNQHLSFIIKIIQFIKLSEWILTIQFSPELNHENTFLNSHQHLWNNQKWLQRTFKICKQVKWRWILRNIFWGNLRKIVTIVFYVIFPPKYTLKNKNKALKKYCLLNVEIVLEIVGGLEICWLQYWCTSWWEKMLCNR